MHSICIHRLSFWRETQALLAGDVLTDFCVPSPAASIWRSPYWGAHGRVTFQAPLLRPPPRLVGKGTLKDTFLHSDSAFIFFTPGPTPPTPRLLFTKMAGAFCVLLPVCASSVPQGKAKHWESQYFPQSAFRSYHHSTHLKAPL